MAEMTESRISKPMEIIMIVIAGIVDFVQFLLTMTPFIGWFIASLVSVCATFFFGIGFYHHGVNLFSSQRILGTLGALTGEATPIINSIPWWTTRISLVVFNEWRKESAV